MDLLTELHQLVQAFKENGVEYALCGGLALAVYAMPRATLDIDIMLEPDTLSKARDIAAKLGFTLQAHPMDFHHGAVRIHRFTKIDDQTGDHLMLVLLLVTPTVRAAWESRQTVAYTQGELQVLSPHGLILLKSMRNSGQDQDDIAYLRSIMDED